MQFEKYDQTLERDQRDAAKVGDDGRLFALLKPLADTAKRGETLPQSRLVDLVVLALRTDSRLAEECVKEALGWLEDAAKRGETLPQSRLVDLVVLALRSDSRLAEECVKAALGWLEDSGWYAQVSWEDVKQPTVDELATLKEQQIDDARIRLAFDDALRRGKQVRSLLRMYYSRVEAGLWKYAREQGIEPAVFGDVMRTRYADTE